MHIAHIGKFLVLRINHLALRVEHGQRRDAMHWNTILVRQIQVRILVPDVHIHFYKVLRQQAGVRFTMEINVEHLAIAAPVSAEIQDYALVLLARLQQRRAHVCRPLLYWRIKLLALGHHSDRLVRCLRRCNLVLSLGRSRSRCQHYRQRNPCFHEIHRFTLLSQHSNGETGILLRMKLFPALLAAALLPAPLIAQTPAPKPGIAPGSIAGTPIPAGYSAIERLWPGRAPGAIGDTFDDIPILYAYPATGPGPHAAVIVLPGGGYNHLVTEKEGGVEARWLNAHGISAYILIYRLAPRYLYPAAMLDGQRAVRFVRAHATQWNIRPDAIGVWGFSAGGHLAGYLATTDPHGDPPFPPGKTYGESASHDAIDALSARPDFAILSYARVDLDPAIPGTFGMKAITGDNAPQSLVDAIDPIKHVTAQTSPSFIYST